MAPMDERILHEIDDTIHAKARLGIMSVLLTEQSASFTFLKSALGLTDGNLGNHVRILEEAGYITVQKAFAERKPRTTCQATEAGRKAFLEYMETLQLLFEATKHGDRAT